MKSFWKHFFLDNGDISLIEAGVQKYIPHQINNYKVKHDFVFHLVLAGKGLYRVNNQTYDLQGQDSFLLKKNNRVYYEPDEDDPWTICWIGMGGSNINDYLRDTRLITDDVFSFEEDSPLFNELIQFINYLMNANTGSTQVRMQIFSHLYQILALMNNELPLLKDNTSDYNYEEPNLAEKVYDYIYSNFLEDITVESVAKHFDISRNYLFKLMKSYYGQPPKQIIQELRMNQASQLLRGSDKQVSEIAEIIGYADPFVFSKMFKNYFGHSPSQFRHLSDESIDEALFIREKFLRLSPKVEE